jgi:glutamate formiminotransferase/formiminotetrahydrofolate cyclodeaminase
MVPFTVMETAYQGFEVIKAMAETGNPNSVSDTGVGALALRSCIRGAFLNVKINASGLEDKTFVNDIIKKARDLEKRSATEEEAIIRLVESKI